MTRLTFQEVTDPSVWQTFISQYAPHVLFQTWEWSVVVEKSGTPFFRIGIYDGTTLVGVMLVLNTRAKRGAFLHIRQGPVFSSDSRAFWQQTIEYLRTRAKQERALFVRMSPLIEDTEENRSMFSSQGLQPAAIHAMDGEYCWVLDLDKPAEMILSEMRKTTRYEIKRAEKMGVQVDVTEDPNKFDAFNTLYNQTASRQGFVQHRGLSEEFVVFAREGKALLYTVTYEGELLAGAIVLFIGSQGIYHHGASIPSKVPASYAIQWQAIQEAQKRGLKVYNFWGIAPEDNPKHPWRGLTLFKKGFGGREIKYIHAYDIPVSPFYAFPRTVELIRKKRKGY